MSTLLIGRWRRFGIVTIMTGLMMSSVAMHRVDASVIRPSIEERLVSYSTTATLGAPGDAPVEFLEFRGVHIASPTPTPAGVIPTPGAFSLGAFTTRAVPTGTRFAFDGFPFAITLNLFADMSGGEVVSQILIEGMLDGELSTNPGKGLLASVSSVTQVGTPIGTPPFRAEDLQLMAPQFIMPAGQQPTATTPFYGYVSAQVPEPTTLATLGVGLVALIAHRRRRQTRERMSHTMA